MVSMGSVLGDGVWVSVSSQHSTHIMVCDLGVSGMNLLAIVTGNDLPYRDAIHILSLTLYGKASSWFTIPFLS